METQSVDRDELDKYLAQLLDVPRIRDYCPNGLQVEGKTRIRTLVSGVTASRALLEAAVAHQADAVLVHHGYFWRDENPCITGFRRGRLATLLQHDLNLFAYHLPLDQHPVLGNNVQLAHKLGLVPDGRFGSDDLGWLGTLPASMGKTAGDLAARVQQHLARTPLLIGDPAMPIGRIAWCSGAAQNLLLDAAAVGATLYLSGEISEQTVHLARETGVAYLACGHHATERYGVMALGDHLAETFGLKHRFIDIDNPV